MSFGLAGSHRSGKTTLAKELSEKFKFHYYDASVSKLMAEAGINAVGLVSLEDRMGAQEYLLEKHYEITQKLPRPFISDRTPLDMIAYTLGEVTMHNVNPQLSERIERYVNRCLTVTANTYDSFIIVRPLEGYEVDPTKPPPIRAYQWQVQMLIEGAAAQLDLIAGCTITTSEHATRIGLISEYIDQRMITMRKERGSRLIH